MKNLLQKIAKNRHAVLFLVLGLLVWAGLAVFSSDASAYNYRSNVMAISAPPNDCTFPTPSNPAACTGAGQPADCTIPTPADPAACNPNLYTGNICPVDYNSDFQGFDPHNRPGLSNSNRKAFGLTKRLILCVKETILYATYSVLGGISTFLSGTIAIVTTLAVTFWGVNVALGRRDAVATKGVTILAVKIGIVIIFTASFAASTFDPNGTRGGLFGMIMDGVEDILGVVTSYINFSPLIKCHNVLSSGSGVVWERVDCALESLIGGIFPVAGKPPYYSLLLGISGFLILCLFSGAFGVLIALLGFYLIMKFVFAIIRAVYIFIMAYTAFALMVLISPIFIPMILFKTTISYFEKWYRLSISFILQPIFLFTYLAMMVAAFDSVIFSGPNSMYRAIAGDQMNGKVLGFYDPSVPNPGNRNDYFALGEALSNGSFNGKPIYKSAKEGQMAIKIDAEQLKRDLGVPGVVDTGTVLGEVVTEETNWDQPGGIFETLNPIRSGSKHKNFFEVAFEKKQVDWLTAAKWSGTRCSITSPPDMDACLTTTYIIRVLLSFVMAVITAYIFVAMLDYLPFIGSGVASDSASFPVFGVRNKAHNMGVPGDGWMSNLRSKLAAKFGIKT